MPSDETLTTNLLRRMHAGNDAARHQLLERHLPAVLAFVRKKLGANLRQKADSADFVQDTVLEFLKYAPSFTISSEAVFRALLCKIALHVMTGKNAWFKAKRREMARESHLAEDSLLVLDPAAPADERPSAQLQNRDREACLRMALEMLSPEDSEVIILRDYEGLAFAQIGERIGISEAAAKKRFQRALPRLGFAVRRIATGRITDLF